MTNKTAAIETVSDERLREHLSFDGWHAFKSLTEAEVKSVVTELLSRRSLDTADGVEGDYGAYDEPVACAYRARPIGTLYWSYSELPPSGPSVHLFEVQPLFASPPAQEAVTRDHRQQQVAEWCAAAFGADHQASVPQRGLRMLEEAIEAYQATTGNAETAHRLIDYIFAKEPGELRQELGGVGITVLALAAAAGLSADDAEASELARVLAKPLAWFHARNKVKNDAGFDATAYPSAALQLGKEG
jgi:NTP pyrophosphatase (non-canonical NTP hydrolase)